MGCRGCNLSLAQDVPQLASWRQVRYVLEDGMTVIFQMNIPLDDSRSADGDGFHGPGIE